MLDHVIFFFRLREAGSGVDYKWQTCPLCAGNLPKNDKGTTYIDMWHELFECTGGATEATRLDMAELYADIKKILGITPLNQEKASPGEHPFEEHLGDALELTITALRGELIVNRGDRRSEAMRARISCATLGGLLDQPGRKTREHIKLMNDLNEAECKKNNVKFIEYPSENAIVVKLTEVAKLGAKVMQECHRRRNIDGTSRDDKHLTRSNPTDADDTMAREAKRRSEAGERWSWRQRERQG